MVIRKTNEAGKPLPGTEKDEPARIPTETHIFFLNTTKEEKVNALNAAARNRQLPVLFMRVTDLGEPSHSPEELTGSFKNNKNEKLFSCAQHLSQFSYKQVKEKLQSLGFSPADVESGKIKFYGCAEDSGFALDRGGPKRAQDTRAFLDMFFNAGENSPYSSDADKAMVKSLEEFCAWSKPTKPGEEKIRKPFPDVETVRVMTSGGGTLNFFRLVNLTMKKLGLPIDAKDPREAKKLRLIDKSVLGAFEWDPKMEDKFLPYLMKNTGQIREGVGESVSVYNGARLEHMSPGRKPVTSYSLSIPLHLTSKTVKKYTDREMLGEAFQPAARGDAMGELLSKFKITGLGNSAWNRYTAKTNYNFGVSQKDRDYTVSVLPGDGNYPRIPLRNHTRKTLEAAGMVAHYPGETEEGANKKHLPRLFSKLNYFQDVVDNHDAVVFMPAGSSKFVDKTRELEQFIMGCYIGIDRALNPKGKGKIAVYIEQKPGDFDRFKHQFNTLYNRGVFADHPDKLFVKATTPEQVVDILEDHRRNYRPVLADSPPDTPVPDIKDKTGKYNVCVFLSASIEGIYEDKAIALGKRIQAQGMTLVYGAADRNMMGGLLKGVEASAKRRHEEPSVMGSTTKVIAATECEHGTKPSAIPDDMFYLAPTITKRKEFLFKNSHAFVVMEGGAGTLDELLTYMWYKENDPKMVENKPLVISESAYTKGSLFREALDLYLGQDTAALNEEDRQRIFKSKGIMIMKPPTQIPEGSRKSLNQIEMDNVIEFLKGQREKHFPHLVPEKKPEGFVAAEQARQQAGLSGGITPL